MFRNNYFYYSRCFSTQSFWDYREKTYYEILGIDRYATQSQVVDAYNKKLKEIHAKPGEGDTYLIQQVNDAYEVLTNHIKRIRYNQEHPLDDPSKISTNPIFEGEKRVEVKQTNKPKQKIFHSSVPHIEIIHGSRDVDYTEKRIKSKNELNVTRYSPGHRNYVPPRKLPVPSHSSYFFGIIAVPAIVAGIWIFNVILTRKEMKKFKE